MPQQPRGAAARSRDSLSIVAWSVAALDLTIMVIATIAAIRFRVSLPFFATVGDVLENTALASAFFVATWLLILVVCGAYEHDVFGAGLDEFRLVVNGSGITAAFVGVSAYLLKYPLSRGFFLLLFVIGVPLLVLGRLFARRVLQRLKQRGRFTERVLLVGTPGYIGEVASVLMRERWLGYEVVGCLLPADYAGLTETSAGIKVVGVTEQLRTVVDELDVGIVCFAAGAVTSSSELRRFAWELEDHEHVQMIVAPNVTDVSSERIRVRPVAGLPLLHLGRSRTQHASNQAKRSFDLVGAAAIVVLTSPVLLGLMAWIRLHDGGPALFRQTRVGKDGKEFSCLKLRSMVMDAEAKLAELEAREGHVLFKDEHDPRITRPGRFVRRFSLDELPQLFNVLRGEMSLVGPRPPLPAEVAQYEDDMLRRLHVLPGMTGLWQVSGRSDLSWEDTVRLDLYYVDNWSMLQDLAILGRTVSAVVAGRGAY